MGGPREAARSSVASTTMQANYTSAVEAGINNTAPQRKDTRAETYDGEDDELAEALRPGGNNMGGGSGLDNMAINAMAGIGGFGDLGGDGDGEGGRGGGGEKSVGGLDLLGPLDIIDAAWGE